MVQIGSKLVNLAKNGSKWFRKAQMVQNGSYAKLVLNCEKCFKIVQTISKGFKMVQNGLKWFKLVQTGSN